ncbi:amino acid permease [Brevibacillus laterosporus]|uniref:Putative amino acid permease YhdG n=1 Tax=Brevibacillus laterosporus LMG 15441 TaxID=1042163 RepID=A0A075R2G1_BRELA|nr:amino acid permease [Brevibacillus laterosporus]AIG25398.1 putative amino acid permease YhdG [Brevibacillus laterosporus LMG 15441]RJL10820.1 amino acid permease [Brevibacillus laterosporus]TPH11151.1 amino acid permease [Brevibacillus laterosporus]HAS01127.1 amino acid permease [Brevibacillus sp.]
MSNLLRKKSVTDLLQQGQNKSLNKTLTSFDLSLLGIGAVLGTGVMVLTGIVAARDAGPAVILSFMIAALVCGFAAFCYSEFASTIPVSGSAYTYTYATLGEFVAHLMGWTLLSVYFLTTSAVAVGWSAYFNNLLTGFGWGLPEQLVSTPMSGGIINLPAVIIVLLITFVLSRGTKESKKFNNFMVLVKLLVILLFIAVGVFYVKPENWNPFLPYGVEGVFAGAAAVFFAFLGFDAVSTSAEECKNPQKALPVGIISSLVVCTILYVIVCLIMTGITSYKNLDVPEAMAYVLEIVGQDTVAGIVAVGAVIGIMAVIFAYVFAGTRVIFAMSRDGLLPKRFSSVNKTDTPVFSTWLTGLLSGGIAGFVEIKELSNLANIGALLTFAMVALSVIVLRKTHPNLERGFKVPLVPFIPILTMVFCAFLMINLPGATWMYFAIWVAIGTVVYFVYSKKHSLLENVGSSDGSKKKR